MEKFAKPEGQFSTSHLVDARGFFCPLPIIKIKKALDELPSGERVEIWADDPAFPEDVLSWCQETQNKLLSLSVQEDNMFIAVVEKNEKN